MTMKAAIKEFLSINRFTESYRDVKKSKGDYNPYLERKPIDLSIQSKELLNRAKNDINIILEAQNNFNKMQGLRIGDFIKLPYGQITNITHVWEDGHIQTGSQGSLHLSKMGYVSRSGGLNTGVKANDLELTEETKSGLIWIFSQGESGVGRGVYFNINFRVYKKKCADLTGCPEVAELARQNIIANSETITRINGNGKEYTMHMPEVRIINPPEELKHKFISGGSFIFCGVTFKLNSYQQPTATGQPMKLEQINKMLKRYKFEGTFYNNASYHNILFLEGITGEVQKQMTTFK